MNYYKTKQKLFYNTCDNLNIINSIYEVSDDTDCLSQVKIHTETWRIKCMK